MKQVVIAVAALAAFATPSLAADMAVKAPMRAAPIAYAPSWTGCYIGGGGGGGMWQQENQTFTTYRAPLEVVTLSPTTNTTRLPLTDRWDAGGRGYFGTVGGGCDYQFGMGGFNLVIGAFGDYDFASIKGRPVDPYFNAGGFEKLSSQWSVGGRVGAVVFPSLLVYLSAGYTEAHFDAVNPITGFGQGQSYPIDVFVPGHTYKGWFIGAGDEYALNFLPGLFWKTEYRFSDLDRGTNYVRNISDGSLTGIEIDSKKFVHTVRSELVYRFNWGGPVVAKY
jgi:outer membrane immunogenic protein